MTNTRSTTEIARLSIVLDEVTPKVLRRFEVATHTSLALLHDIIQVVMGWEDCHLYEFYLKRDVRWVVSDPDWPDDSLMSADRATLADVLAQLKRKKTFRYTYDFGDDWRHTVKLEALAPADPDVVYPRLLEAQGACPPEDCGGPWGYADMLAVFADPAHERHDEIKAWMGDDFDPQAVVDEGAIRDALQDFAETLCHPRRR